MNNSYNYKYNSVFKNVVLVQSHMGVDISTQLNRDYSNFSHCRVSHGICIHEVVSLMPVCISKGSTVALS